MFSRAKVLMMVICLLPLLAQAEQAKDVKYVELQSRTTKLYVDYVVNSDFTSEKISEVEIKALTDKSAQSIKRQKFSHSTSVEKLEVLDAYTKKADGSRIDVPKDNYQVTVNKGKGDNGAIFSDRTRVTIVFPNLEKNDSVYMKIRNIVTEPMFPGNYTAAHSFWSQTAFDDVKIRFDLPDDLIFKKQVRGMKETTATKNGRKIIELTYQAAKPVQIDRQNYSVWDESKEAGYALSTFGGYESLAKKYGERALPKAKPTKKLKQLAVKIIGNATERKEQARLLYDWVATNISYAGHCIGVGAVVPHDLDFILENKMGDCKDHATLLQALYSSVGIQSTQALINSGSRYALPEIPVVSSVNHVISYIPEWDMFLDSTNPSLPFGMLNFRLSDKPVILVEGYKPNQRTPATKVGANFQEVKSTMKIHSDGSVTGDIHVTAEGRPAVELRRAWRHATKEQEDDWLKQIFSSQFKIGSASMKKDDPVPLTPEFSYTVEFNKPEFILPDGVDGFYIYALAPTPMATSTFLQYGKEDIKGYDVACGNGHSIERLTYEFPKGLKILAKPDDLEIDENHIYFKATYTQTGNKLEVVREINDKTPGNVCSAEFVNKQRQTLIKIAKNMRAKVIYQH